MMATPRKYQTQVCHYCGYNIPPNEQDKRRQDKDGNVRCRDCKAAELAAKHRDYLFHQCVITPAMLTQTVEAKRP